MRYGSDTPDDSYPWALFGMPIADMLTPAGIAWIELMLEEGNGCVSLLVASETEHVGSRVPKGWCKVWCVIWWTRCGGHQ